MFWTGFTAGAVLAGVPLALVAIANHARAVKVRDALGAAITRAARGVAAWARERL